jgi:AraC-like DNA-binding protein
MNKSTRTVLPSHDIIQSGSEHINICFIHKGTALNLTCKLLEAGLTDRREKQIYNHPDPPFSRLFLFVNNGAKVNTPNGEYHLQSGMIHLLPAGQPFRVEYDISKLVYFHIYVHDTTGESVFNTTNGVPHLDNSVLFEQIVTAYNNDNHFMLLNKLLEAIRLILEPALDKIAKKAIRTQKFSLLFNHMSTFPPATITIDELADMYKINAPALSKRFQRTMGTPLKKYLTRYIITKSRELLLHTALPVAEIAAQLGFNSSQYFHRFFKKHCGTTPTEYRNMNM